MENGKAPIPGKTAHVKALLPIALLPLLVLFLVLYCTLPVRPGSSAQWITAPNPSLRHNLTDEELFRRAVSVRLPEKSKAKKVAFMFLARGGLPLSPLWERFFQGNQGLYSIYVHSLPSYKPRFLPSSVFYERQIPSQVSQWGKISICAAERRLLANALLDPSNHRFVLLSESCIPLRNFTAIHTYITESAHSFVNSFDAQGPHGRGRYNPAMSPEINLTEWRKGSQWFEVDRALARLVVSDTKFYPKFAEHCKPPCYADEHYFPTALTVEAGVLLANRSLTWVDWSRGGSHPATFGGKDVTEGLLTTVRSERRGCLYNGGITSVCHLFARKFSPGALPALLEMSPRILGF